MDGLDPRKVSKDKTAQKRRKIIFAVLLFILAVIPIYLFARKTVFDSIAQNSISSILDSSMMFIWLAKIAVCLLVIIFILYLLYIILDK